MQDAPHDADAVLSSSFGESSSPPRSVSSRAGLGTRLGQGLGPGKQFVMNQEDQALAGKLVDIYLTFFKVRNLFLFHGDGKAIGQHKKPIYDTPKPSVDSLPPSYKTEDPPPVATSSGYHSQTNLITSPATNYGSPFVRSETLPPTIHADQHPNRLGRQVSATWDINPVVPRRSVSQPTPAPAGAYTYHTPRSSCGAHGGGDEYKLMIHPASMNRLLYNASDYVYMHSTQSPAKYSNYDFVPPASSLSTISEVERPTPYENHTLPQELSCQSK
eukprot:Em0166g9a